MKDTTAVGQEIGGTETKKPAAKSEIADRILNYVRDRLAIRLPYLNRALLMMPIELLEEGGASEKESGLFVTDGEKVYARPNRIIHAYRQDQNLLTHGWLHMIFHCLYSHPFHIEELDPVLWDAASDYAAEYQVLCLGAECTALEDDDRRRELLDELTAQAGGISAERIYHYLISSGSKEDLRSQAEKLFRFDAHDMWFSGSTDNARTVYISRAASDTLERRVGQWMRIQQSAGAENISVPHGHGEQGGTKRVRIRDFGRDTCDYTKFLMRFAEPEEEVHLNQDEFDCIFYTYGLRLYEKMPLIEPLEYRERKKIREFVIAIDTSGSCQGQTVREFLSKTYSILKNSEAFTQPMNLWILQCDCEIQSAVKITSEEQFTRYMNEVEIIGAGGTDFRPVFEKIDQMIAEGEFRSLRGLLYFTDGLGRFPERAPAYRTAFISVGRESLQPHFPSWAEHLLMRETDA